MQFLGSALLAPSATNQWQGIQRGFEHLTIIEHSLPRASRPGGVHCARPQDGASSPICADLSGWGRSLRPPRSRDAGRVQRSP
jgi:hypothetical protein